MVKISTMVKEKISEVKIEEPLEEKDMETFTSGKTTIPTILTHLI